MKYRITNLSCVREGKGPKWKWVGGTSSGEEKELPEFVGQGGIEACLFVLNWLKPVLSVDRAVYH